MKPDRHVHPGPVSPQRASPDDLDAFVAAFQNYATAVYQSYFAKYAGQTLKVTGSTERTPTDFIVQTQLIDPGIQPAAAGSGFPGAHRRRQAGGGGCGLSGIWLALEERDQFVAFLGQNNGNIRTLIAHLSDLAANWASPRSSNKPRQCHVNAAGV